MVLMNEGRGRHAPHLRGEAVPEVIRTLLRPDEDGEECASYLRIMRVFALLDVPAER